MWFQICEELIFLQCNSITRPHLVKADGLFGRSLIPWAKFEGAMQSPIELLVPPFQRITSGRTFRESCQAQTL